MKTTLKNILPWILLVLALVGFVVWYLLTNRISAQQTLTYEQKIVEANTFYQAKEYSSAMKDYYEAADTVPSRVEAFQGIVTILLDKNRPLDAIEILDKSAQKLEGEDQASLYVLIGNYLLTHDDYDKALETYKKGQGLGISNANLELGLGKVYLKKGDLNKAAEQFGKDLYTDDNLSEAKLLLSYVQAISDTNVAKATLESIKPTDKWKPYFDEFSTVLTSLNTDVKFNGTKLARIYINNGYPQLAKSILEPLEAQLVEYLEGVYFLGRAYMECGQYDEAIVELNKAITLGGMEDVISWAEARAYMQKSDLNSAIEYYTKAIRYESKNSSESLVSEYLDALVNNNQTVKANEVIQSVVTNVSDPYIYLYGVKVNDAANNAEKVNYYLTQLEKITLTEDENKEYLYWKAKTFLDQNGDIENTMTILENLLKLDRYNPQYYLLYGRLQFEQGNATEAANAFKKALEYDLDGSVTDAATKLLSSVD